jgi:hypothetical protein
MRSSIPLLTATAVAASAALVVFPATAGAAPAVSLYSYATENSTPEFFGFVTLSPTTAAAQSLPTNSATDDLEVFGAEICAGAATAVGSLVGLPAAVMSWSTTSGSPGAPQALEINPNDVPGNTSFLPVTVDAAYDLDTIADCTIYGLVEFT